MSFYFNPVHYKVSENQLANQTTIAPVSPDQPFYQEVQKKKVGEDPGHQTIKHCSIHSINIFAGRCIVDVPQYAERNNAYWIDVYKAFADKILGPDMDLVSYLKLMKCYITCTKDIQESGIGGPAITKKYIEQNRQDFSLPLTSRIIVVEQASTRREKTIDMEQTLYEIDDNPRLHRVMILLFSHSITFRRDQKGLWRVLDSMVLSHEKTGSDALSRVQPRCKSLLEVVQRTVPKIREFYNALPDDNGIRAIIYPSKEYAIETLKMTESLDLPQEVTNIIDQYIQ